MIFLIEKLQNSLSAADPLASSGETPRPSMASGRPLQPPPPHSVILATPPHGHPQFNTLLKHTALQQLGNYSIG